MRFKNNLKISVIIPTYNREKLISQCLKSVYKTKYPNFEVIVVDDGSTDNSIKVAKQFPCKIVKLKRNMGASYARNAGAKNAKGEILYFVDSDVIQKGDNIIKIMHEFKKDPKLEVLAASLSKEPFNKGFGPSFITLKYYYLTSHTIRKKDLKKQRVTFFPSSSVAIKKEIFDKTGGFDTSFKLGGEEHELGHRISKDHTIYIDQDIEVLPNLPTILKRAIILFKRSITHVSVFSQWKKFEPFGSLTLKEAFITLLVLLIILAFLFSLLFFKMIILGLFLFALFLILELRFYYFLFNQKNFSFMIKGIFADFILYFSKSIGTFIGFFKTGYTYIMQIIKKSHNSIKFLFNILPSHLVLFVTSKCNANCDHCFLDKTQRDKNLDLNKIKRISKNLNHIHYLSITGGEPSLNSNITNICRVFYENNGLQSITYHTNGILPSVISGQIKDIIEYCPRLNLTVAVSLDAMGKYHDNIRGKNGCFRNALKTIDLLKALKIKNNAHLRIVINTTYSKFNKNKLEKLHYFVRDKLNLPHTMSFIRGNLKCGSSKDINVKDYEITIRKWVAENNKKNLNPYFSVMRSITSLRPKIIRQIVEKQKQILSCKAGTKSIVITSNGDVYPCEMLNKSFGNLKDYNYKIKKMLFSSKNKQVKSYIKLKKCFCTWECIMPLNIIFNLKAYPWLAREFFSNLIKK